MDSWSSIAFNPLSHGRVIFAGPLFVGGVFRSDDGGYTWAVHDSLIAPHGNPMSGVAQIFCVPSDTNIVLAVTDDNFFRSTDGGITWSDRYNHDSLGGDQYNFGGMDGESIGYNFGEDAIYYGEATGAGVWRSDDHGADWTLVGPMPSDSIQLFSMDVSQDASPILIQSSEFDNGFLARSTDLGKDWTITFRGTENMETPKIMFSWQAIDPRTNEHSIAIAQRWLPTDTTGDSTFLATTDGGATWQILNKASARPWALDIDQRASMLSKLGDPAYPRPLHFFTGFFDVLSDTIANGMVQETTDGGISWHSTGFPKGVPGDTSNPAVREIWVLKYDTSSGRIAVATDSGVYIADPTSGVVEEQPDVTPPIQLTQDPDFVSLSSNRPIESIRIFDIAGRQILEAAPMREIFRINTNAYPPGIYALEAFVEGQPPFRKLLQW